MRISPNELAFNTAQAFRDIYGSRPGGCFTKDRSHYLPPANDVDHLVCAIDNGVHARQRRLLAHAFSERALRDQEGLIRGYVDTMIGKLQTEIARKDAPVVDIKNWMNYTTFDITGDLMFGESFDCLKDSQLHPWIQLIFSSIKALAIAGVAQQFPILQATLDALIPGEVKRKAVEHFDLAAQKVDRRLETNMARPDFMSAILQHGLSETKGQYNEGERIMSRAEIHSNAFMFVVDLTTHPPNISLVTIASTNNHTNDQPHRRRQRNCRHTPLRLHLLFVYKPTSHVPSRRRDPSSLQQRRRHDLPQHCHFAISLGCDRRVSAQVSSFRNESRADCAPGWSVCRWSICARAGM